jgi:hypothetical protein
MVTLLLSLTQGTFLLESDATRLVLGLYEWNEVFKATCMQMTSKVIYYI